MKPSGIDGMQAIERLRNGGQPDLAAKVELALSFAYAEGRKDEREQWTLAARQALNALNTCDGDKDGYKGPVQWFDEDAVNCAIIELSEALAEADCQRYCSCPSPEECRLGKCECAEIDAADRKFPLE
jgi:hypothetical protein